MGDVASLELREAVEFDRKRLESMVALLGDKSAERVALRALDELGEALAEIDAAWRARDVHRIVACAEVLEALCEDVGMTDLARIARDVSATGRGGDPAGFGATVGRLTRVIEAALRLACGPIDLPV